MTETVVAREGTLVKIDVPIDTRVPNCTCSDVTCPLVHPRDLVADAQCTCCPHHADRDYRMAERVRDIHVILSGLEDKLAPVLAMMGQPGGIGKILTDAINPFGRKGKG